MLDNDQEKAFERSFARLRLIASAMAGGVCFSAAAVAAISRLHAARSAPLPDGAAASVRWTLDSLLLLMAVAGPPLKERLLSDSALLEAAKGGFSTLMSRIQARLIALLALCEAAAFLGIVLFLLSNRPLDLLPAGIVSLAGFAGLWPDRLRWRERVEALLAG